METELPRKDGIVIIPTPVFEFTEDGHTKESVAAAYLAHHTQSKVTLRMLRDWRSQGKGPVFHVGRGTRAIWYSKADLDHWRLVESARDPDDELGI